MRSPLPRRHHVTLIAVFLLGCCGWALAQTASAADAEAAKAGVGQSVIPLNGPWKFEPGDSPRDEITGATLWAQAGFDDSKWETVDLTPKEGTFDAWNGASGYVAGWTAKGHPGYSGFAWYRIHVKVDAQPGQRLALAGPADVDDAYQVFSNGRLLGSFGDFGGKTPTIYFAQPQMFPLSQVTGSSDLVIAFRVWMGKHSLLQQPQAGGMHNAPLLGDAGAIGANYQIRWQKLLGAYSPLAFEALMYALLAMMAFSLLLFDHTDRVYLWAGSLLALTAIDFALSAITSWTTYLNFLLPTIIRDNFLTPLVCGGWVMLWWVWFRLHRPPWLPRVVDLLTILLILANSISGELLLPFVSHSVAVAFLPVALVIRLLFFLLLAWVVWLGIKRKALEGWLVFPIVVFRGIGQFQREHSALHLQSSGTPLGLDISAAQICNLLMALTIGLLLLRRLLLALRQQRLMAQDINQRLLKSGQDQYLMAMEVKQAQEVQQVILPEARSQYPGLLIESEYRPARAVGGDFFQIIPRPIDGSLLIVAGDITGKGLKAGMLVAFLVGAIRTTVEWSADPVVVLKALNRLLLGRKDAQATCLALRINADGEVILANAGHIPPYLNGEAMPIEGALPLGMQPDSDLTVTRFKLAEGDRLVLMSDGIVEAMDAAGNLFGFERVQELVRRSNSASEVAAAAQRFGQEDDISVISVTRTHARKPALV
jgi:hypothetical protein